MRNIEYITRQIKAYLDVLRFAQQNNYIHVVFCETTDLINSICKELVLCIDKTPSESLGENIKAMRELGFDEALLALVTRYYEYQYCNVNYNSFDFLSFLCTISCVILELRRCVIRYDQNLAADLTGLGIDICKYMETL